MTEEQKEKFIPGTILNVRPAYFHIKVTKVRVITEEEYNKRASCPESSQHYLLIEHLDKNLGAGLGVDGLSWTHLDKYLLLQETDNPTESLAHWNTTCRFCSSKAYIGAVDLICSNQSCVRYRA